MAKVLELQHQCFHWYSGLISFRIDGLISSLSKGLSRVFSRTTVWKHQFFSTQLVHSPTLTSIHDYWKTTALTRQTFLSKVMSLLFNMLCRFVIAFLPRSKCLLFSWLQSPPTVILEPRNIKSATVTIISPSIAIKWWDWMPWSSFFECWVLSQPFHSHLPPSSRGSLVPLHFLTLGWYHLHIWGCWCFTVSYVFGGIYLSYHTLLLKGLGLCLKLFILHKTMLGTNKQSVVVLCSLEINGAPLRKSCVFLQMNLEEELTVQCTSFINVETPAVGS